MKLFVIVSFSITFVIILIVLFALWRGFKMRNKVFSGSWMSHKEFQEYWSGTVRQKGFAPSGLKRANMSGCYIIAVYAKPRPDDIADYEHIYIGKSVNITKQVHDILSGKSKLKIADVIRKKKAVFVQLIPCEKNKMGKCEKQLNAAFSHFPIVGGRCFDAMQ